jgi:hypothetical protein
MLLSTLTVNSLSDSGAGSGTRGDLRYCITEANLSTSSTINFSVTGTIQLTKALPALSANVTINGPGATSQTIEGGGKSSNFSVLTIENGVTATISGLTISGGHTNAGGGGIHNLGVMTLTDCTISDDSALTGGGIENTGAMTLVGCTVSQVAGKYGGGVTNYIGGTAVIMACTITKNTADNQGGGISTYGPLKLINSTVVGNTAASAGGIYVDSETGSTTVTNCTVTGNRETGAGGGGIHAFGPTTLYNTIVCGNFGGTAPSTTPNDIAGSVNKSASFNNLIGTGGSGGLANGSNGNLVAIVNPGLGTLSDNGGPTQTVPLLAGSPAIDVGDNAKALDASGKPLTTDQRGPGFPRVQGARVDIGAFEAAPTPTPTINWLNPADIVYGTALDSTQLDATASVTVDGSTVIVPGTFTYSPAAGTLLNAGNDQTLKVTFTPTDTTDYTGATATVNINVDQATPELGVNPVNLTYGTPLIDSPLTGSATWTVGGNAVTVPGSWSYTSSAGTVLDAGNDQSESVTFTPTDSVDYTGMTAMVTINVSHAAPDLSVNPVDLTYGTPLANSQLTGPATWTVSGHLVTVAGSWSYTSAAGVVLSAGAGQSESVTFTPTNSVDYTSVTAGATVNVSRAIPEATVNAANLTYGTSLANSQLTGNVTWTVGGSVVTVAGSWSYTGAADRVLSAGPDQKEPVTFTPIDSPDYSSFAGTVTVNVAQAPLLITANNASKVYGAALPDFTFSYSGFVNGDSASNLNPAPSPSTLATASSPVGNYAISPSGAVDPNYNITFLGGALSVTPAKLTITANNATKISGQTNPAFTATYSGFVNGDKAASLTVQPSFSSTATKTSPPGDYPITASGAVDANYTINYVDGTLTVNPPLATVKSVEVENVKSGKTTTEVIAIQFSEALTKGAAQNIKNYSLVTVPKSKKQSGKPVSLARAAYNAKTFSVTLTTSKALTLSPPVDLTITAARLLDALGRPLAANYSATLKTIGVPVIPIVPFARTTALAADAVDAALAKGVRGVR